MILGIVMCQASPIGSKVLGLKFKVGKVLEKVLGPDPRIRNLMAFPIGREVLGLKFNASG